MIVYTERELYDLLKRHEVFPFGPKNIPMKFVDSLGSPYMVRAGEMPIRNRVAYLQECWRQFEITTREMDEIVQRAYGGYCDVVGAWRTTRRLSRLDMVKVLLELQNLVPQTQILGVNGKKYKVI